MTLEGTYNLTMILPKATAKDQLILIPTQEKNIDGYVLDGKLVTQMGEVRFNTAYWNKNYFFINMSVGPGNITLAGKEEGDRLSGVVYIDNCPDMFEATRVK